MMNYKLPTAIALVIFGNLQINSTAFAQNLTVEQSARAAIEAARSVENRLQNLLPEQPCADDQSATWKDSKFVCSKVVTACRVCIQLESNTPADGRKECSEWTTPNGQEVKTPASLWAQGAKYAATAWLQCK